MDLSKAFEGFPSEGELLDIVRHTSITVWENELFEKDIEKWLGNFTGEVFDIHHERLLALWLLSNFTYYNEHEVKHLCRVLYNDLIHIITTRKSSSTGILEDDIRGFFNRTNIVTPEKTSGSGGFIAYYFRHENSLPMTLFNYSLDNISKDVENVIFIDDVTLSEGDQGQMHIFLDNEKKKLVGKNIYLLSLVSSESAYNHLESTFNINIVTAIKLDNRDKAFHTESDIFSYFPDLNEIAKKFSEHYGKKINIMPNYPLGHGNGQYTFGFFYNTPDNTLPIFWGQINNWSPILKRYHKNYKTQKYLHHERFI